MAGTLTIRNLDEALKARLRLQAARRGHSMEQEARDILRRALLPPSDEPGLAQRIRSRFAGLGGEELPIPARRPARQPDVASAVSLGTSPAVHEPSSPDYRVAASHPAPAPAPARRRRP